MAPRTPRQQRSTPNVSDLHRRWLELVDTDGPFLAIAPLKRVWPQGMPSLDDDRKEALHYARKDFEVAWEALDRGVDDGAAADAYRIARDKWVEAVLRDVAGWAESLFWGEVTGVQAQSPNQTVTVTAQAALIGTDGNIGALVSVIDPVDSLRQTPNDLWAATPIDRMEALLRENNIPIGIVTDGRWWSLVCARPNAMAASGIVDALTWVEEPRTRDAFLAIISRKQIIGGDPTERLPVLFEESVAAAEEITEALGAQVRGAVELLIQSFSESARDAQQRGERNPLPPDTHESYEAAVTIMMRIVFLLFAEERGLLPAGELFEQGYGISRELDRLQGREAEESEEALGATSLTWHRLLATSRALYGGASFENMRVPAYGGSLFDPARFPFLTATTAHGTLAVTVSDRVMLQALRSVQQAVLKGGEARRISFRDIDVEQIGYIYEGLLGYTAVTVDEAHVGLQGARGEEPEIPLRVLEELARSNSTPKKLAETIRAWVEKDQPSAQAQSAAALAKGIDAEADPSMVSGLAQAVGDDAELRERVLPWLGLIRQDLRKRPMVVLDGGLMVKETPSRKNAGAHYTPKSLAQEVVLHALEPLCYSPGPHQTADKAQWKLKSSDDLLNLKVADIACGSGAFLVSAAGYLADRVVEAWTSEDPANARRQGLHRRAIREVVANCLYGADINDMAVEMCKLSLWLVSLDRDLPFSFVDDKIFIGNSLLGLTSLDQLRRLHIDPSRVPTTAMIDFYDIDIDAIIQKAVDLRRTLASEVDENDPARSSAAKHRQLAELHCTTADLRKIADGVVGAGLALGGKPGRALDEAYEHLRIAVKAAYSGKRHSSHLDSIIEIGLAPTVVTDYERWQPVHWALEAPDVLVERGGFDAVVGNPPFLGSNKTPGAVGENLHDWIANTITGGMKLKADMVAFFVVRATSLLETKYGTLGLIASHAIAQGDTREVSLDRLSTQRFELMRAIQSKPWPATAGASYSAVWGTWYDVGADVPRVCDGVTCSRIATFLEPAGRVLGTPARLSTGDIKAYNGCYLLGTEFVVAKEMLDSWINADPRNKDVLRPYLNGDDLTSRPLCDASQWVIDFNDRSFAEASSYALPFAHVEKYVKPMREGNNRKAVAERWWQYAEKRPSLRVALQSLDRCVAVRQSGNCLMPVYLATGQVIDQTVVIFGTDAVHLIGVLSSSIHQAWVATHGLRTMAGILRYTPSDVFDTFPMPEVTDELTAVSYELDEERRRIMRNRDTGIGDLYKALNNRLVSDHDDLDIARLREIHGRLDGEIMRSYGWSNVQLDHGFHTYRKMERWTVCPAARVEILDRLLEENHRRAALEASTGKTKKSASRTKKVSEDEETLFS